jgi:hypothetical protein
VLSSVAFASRCSLNFSSRRILTDYGTPSFTPYPTFLIIGSEEIELLGVGLDIPLGGNPCAEGGPRSLER